MAHITQSKDGAEKVAQIKDVTVAISCTKITVIDPSKKTPLMIRLGKQELVELHEMLTLALSSHESLRMADLAEQNGTIGEAEVRDNVDKARGYAKRLVQRGAVTLPAIDKAEWRELHPNSPIYANKTDERFGVPEIDKS